jgi:hypothetical protein
LHAIAVNIAFGHDTILVFRHKIVAIVKEIGFCSAFAAYLIKAPEWVVEQFHVIANQDKTIFHVVQIRRSCADPYTASNVSWNQTVSFGMQGDKGSENAELPQLQGELCTR